jgi:hypothetical protein
LLLLGWGTIELDDHTLQMIIACLEAEDSAGLALRFERT